MNRLASSLSASGLPWSAMSRESRVSAAEPAAITSSTPGGGANKRVRSPTASSMPSRISGRGTSSLSSARPRSDCIRRITV